MSLIPYYTSAQPNFNVVDPHESIGGYRSNTVVANGMLHGLFPGITSQSDGFLVRCIVLLNSSSQDLSDVSIIFNETDTLCSWQIAASAPNSSGAFERLMNDRSLPYTGTFYEASSSVSLGTIVGNGQLALWIRRTINPTAVQNLLSYETLVANFTQNPQFGPPPVVVNNCNVVVSWS